MTRVMTSRRRTLLRIGSIGPLGHLPASGTMTVAVVGLPLYALMHDWPAIAYAAATLCFTGTAIWIHDVGDVLLGEKDSRRLVWDEVAGFLFAVAFVPFTWQLAALSLLLERAIDIVKIPPARWIERHLPGGWGVVGDDVLAGVYTCCILHLILRLAPAWVGIGP